MSLELVRGRLIDRQTGEVPSLANVDTVTLADAIAALRALHWERHAALRQVETELVERTDEAVANGDLAAYTFEIGDYKVAVDSPAVRGAINVGALRRDLLADADALNLTRERIEALFTPNVTYTLDNKAFGTLARLMPVLENYREHQREAKRRGVKVERLRPARADADSTAIEGEAA